MSDRTNSKDRRVETDGGTGAEAQGSTEYLEMEVNLLRPSTSFMRDHLRVVWAGFILWVIVVFGPPTLTFLAPNAMMTTIPGLGFPLHYFLVAIGGPGGALLLSIWYARQRDQLDEKYGIEHPAPKEADEGGEDVAAADGGTPE